VARGLLSRVPVPIRDHTELIAWQLADRLRALIWKMTETGAAAREFKFRSQIRDSISAVCRNLAEGFYRFEHPEFAQFTRIARGSLGETRDLLLEGTMAGYFSAEDVREAQNLSKRAMVAVSRLHRYLRSTKAPRHT
jgi:four helix bundle protein